MREGLRSALDNAGNTSDAQFSCRIVRGSYCSVGVFRWHYILVLTAIVAILFFYVHNIGHARAAEAASKPASPDINRGAVIAAQGTRAGAAACAQCHAFDGSSDGSGAFPRITRAVG